MRHISDHSAVIENPLFHLVAFADSRMGPTLERLHNQASKFKEIKSIFLFTEKDLSDEFVKQAEYRLRPSVRGFGYWVWKPEVILLAMNSISDGEIMCYCDAGFHLNFNGAEHLKRYFAPIQRNEVDLVAFSHDKSLLGCIEQSSELPVFKEFMYTKGDMLDFWSARGQLESTHTPQYASGLFFMKKSENTLKLLRQWKETALSKPYLFDDSPSTSPNIHGFIENRHDQSYFSLMCKNSNHVAFSAFEFWYPRGPNLIADWRIISNFPFHARRDRRVSSGQRGIMLARRLISYLTK